MVIIFHNITVLQPWGDFFLNKVYVFLYESYYTEILLLLLFFTIISSYYLFIII